MHTGELQQRALDAVVGEDDDRVSGTEVAVQQRLGDCFDLLEGFRIVDLIPGLVRIAFGEKNLLR
jgi:hypothetical protein